MFNFKTMLLGSALVVLFTGCLPQLKVQNEVKKMPNKVDYLIETKDVNNIKELEVSNNLIQFLPVISISGVQVLFDEEAMDEKPMFFRNEKCIFQGTASADLTTKRVKVKLSKATCRTDSKHKINYMVNGWILGEDESFGLEASKEVLNKIDERDYEERMPLPKEKTVLSVKQGEYAYVYIDMVKQIETLKVKNQIILKSKETPIMQKSVSPQKTRLMKMP